MTDISTSSCFNFIYNSKREENISTHASHLKQDPHAYLLNADVSLMLRRCPRGAANVGELGGVTVAMHWETDSSLWAAGLEVTAGRLNDEGGTGGGPWGQFSPPPSS